MQFQYSATELPTLHTLTMLRDALVAFSSLIGDLANTSKKHNISLNEIKDLDRNPDFIRDLAVTLDLSNHPLSDIPRLQNVVADFMNCDDAQLSNFHQKLNSTINTFNEVE